MQAVSNTDITQHVTMTVTQATNHADLLSRLSQNESVSITAASPPLQTDRPISYDGTVYNVSREITDHSPATRYTIALTESTVTAKGESVQFSSLPAVDRQKLVQAGLSDGNAVGVATTIEYTDEERSESDLVPSPTHPVIEWSSGNQARIEIRDHISITVYTYKYSASEVGSVSAYGKTVLDQYGFSLTGLSSDEEQIVAQARKGAGYVVENDQSLPSAFRSLVQRFESENAVQQIGASDVSGDYLVMHQNETYWTKLVVQQSARKS